MFFLPQFFYLKYLEKIGGIRFTNRETEIISYLLQGRTEKEIASFLSIEDKSVSSHTFNIRNKINGISKSSILDFIEKSDKISLIKNEYYQSIQMRVHFETELKKIALKSLNNVSDCIIVDCYTQTDQSLLLSKIKDQYEKQILKHLTIAGINVIKIKKSEFDSFNSLNYDWEINSKKHILFLVDSDDDNLFSLKSYTTKFLDLFNETNYKDNIISFSSLISTETQNLKEFKLFDDAIIISLFDFKKYYSLVIYILEKLISNKNLIVFGNNFIEKLEDSNLSLPIYSIQKNKQNLDQDNQKMKKNFFINKKIWWIMGVFSSFGIFCFLTIILSKENSVFGFFKEKKFVSIRSDLIIPKEEKLLKRTHLIAKIDQKLKGIQNIQTVVLIGVGGSGKTTLAREYARLQNFPIVWELNSETNQSLFNSFKDLAYAIAQSSEEKKELKNFEEIIDFEEKKKRIIHFVKSKLKDLSGWFLIYDNLENISDIHHYIPQDSNTWGRGKVIITTRNNCIENTFCSENIQVNELDQKEKFELFKKIILESNINNYEKNQLNEAIHFLTYIPSFPLDVSIASYYLKITQIPYVEYLGYLKEQNSNFESLQADILTSNSDYKKTRYHIIKVMLNQIMSQSKDYTDLLIFISLLDSQTIPKDLLETYKDKITVERFIQILKSYSLITFNDHQNLKKISSFSIHRSFQKIMLNILTKSFSLTKITPQICDIISIMDNYTGYIIDEHQISKMRTVLPHCETLLNKNNFLNLNYKVKLMGAIGYIKFLLGDYIQAKHLLSDSLELHNNSHSEDQSQIARTLSYSGNMHRGQANYAQAIHDLEKSLDLYNKKLPYKQSDISWILINLGITHERLSNFEKATQYLIKSIGIRTHLFGKENVKTTWSKINLGGVYEASGQYEKAQRLLLECLSECEKGEGKNSHKYSKALLYLGLTYSKLGFNDKAKTLLEESTQIFKNNYPEEGVSVAWISVYLGNLYRQLEKYDEAKNLIQKSLVIHQKIYPKGHLCIGWISSSLGNIYAEIGQYEKAKSLLNEGLTIYEKNYGKNNLKTASILKDLGYVFLLEELFLDVSEAYLQKSLLIYNKYKHPDAYIVFEILASLYQKKAASALKVINKSQSQNFKNQEIEFLQKALQIININFPKDSPHRLRVQVKLQKLYTLTK